MTAPRVLSFIRSVIDRGIGAGLHRQFWRGRHRHSVHARIRILHRLLGCLLCILRCLLAGLHGLLIGHLRVLHCLLVGLFRHLGGLHARILRQG